MIMQEPEMENLHFNARLIEYEINSNDCWICTSHKCDTSGYPMVRRNGKFWKANRYSYTIHKGDIPKGLVIRHTCDNPACINPDHLILGTQKDNVQDMIERNRFRDARGDKNPNFKDFNLAAINNDYQLGMKVVDILEKYGISKTHFYRLRKENKIKKD